MLKFCFHRIFSVFCLLLLLGLEGCLFIPQGLEYREPEVRPRAVEEYYSRGDSYLGFTSELVSEGDEVDVERIYLDSQYGRITVSYYRRNVPSPNLILIFPILGGKNIFSTYFAEYFSERGYDCAIVHRASEFKRPENFFRIEEVFRQGIVRDRIAMDFFEEEYGKENFGSFGISRGAINAAILGGVDPRLKYNVLALGASDIVNVFRYSTEPGIRKYYHRVRARADLTEEEFFSFLEETVRTDPKHLAKYMDAKNTLMFLSVFDSAVPVQYGLRLRKAIGRPDTVMLMSGHYSALAFTRFVPLFPVDYIESESLEFYDRVFEKDRMNWLHAPFKLIQVPF